MAGPMSSHRDDQALENAEFLLSTGMHFDRVARRLGLPPETLKKKFERRASGDRHPGAPPRTGEATR